MSRPSPPRSSARSSPAANAIFWRPPSKSAAKADARRAERIARIAAISDANSPLPQDRKYPVILADPPWKFEVYDAETGFERAAGNHYPTMPLGGDLRLPVPASPPDAVLFLWTTAPHLREAFG